MKSMALCYAAFVGFNPVVETLIQKGVGKEYKQPVIKLEILLYTSVEAVHNFCDKRVAVSGRNC